MADVGRDAVRREGTFTGLSDSEAKEFHRLFMLSFIIFTAIAIVAHFLVWQWRPWLPGPNGYAAAINDAKDMAAAYIAVALAA